MKKMLFLIFCFSILAYSSPSIAEDLFQQESSYEHVWSTSEKSQYCRDIDCEKEDRIRTENTVRPYELENSMYKPPVKKGSATSGVLHQLEER